MLNFLLEEIVEHLLWWSEYRIASSHCNQKQVSFVVTLYQKELFDSIIKQKSEYDKSIDFIKTNYGITSIVKPYTFIVFASKLQPKTKYRCDKYMQNTKEMSINIPN